MNGGGKSKTAFICIAALLCIAAAPSGERARPIYGSSRDELILLPPRDGEGYSPQQILGKPYLPLVVACAKAETERPKLRRKTFAVWEFSDGIGIPGPSVADHFVGRSARADMGGDAPYTLAMIIGERRGAPAGRYTNGALVYSASFDYCLIDMPEKRVTARERFSAHPPKSIAEHSSSYSELRCQLTQSIAALPVEPSPSR